MAQRNILYTGPILETEHGPIHPEPCVVPYGGIPSFPQPTNNHTILPPSGNRTSFNPQHMPETHGPLPHGITQFNGLDHLHHPANNVFMTPAGARVFPVHAMQDQSPFFNIRGTLENCQFVDGFKRKNAEGFPNNVQYFCPTVGSSSSAMNTEGTMMDGPSLVMEPPVHRSGRNRGVDPVLTHSSGHLIPGNYGAHPLQAVPNPWMDQPFCGNGNDGGAFSWNHGPGLPYLQGPINGGGMEAANVGLHGYQVTPSNRNPTPFVHPTAITPHHNLHCPPPMQGPNIDFHSQLVSASRRLPTNATINPFRFVGPAHPNGVGVVRPHRRELMVEANARHRVFPHLRVLPEDGVAILDISGYHEVGNSVDQHRDMRLDIDHMSYEELVALGEQIGSAGSGLSDEFILEHLKTRVLAMSISSADQELNSCVICQTNYDDQEQIGVLDCGHEYHVECVKKWLAVKNTCPVCKSTALAAKAKES
ncbi:putative transcription factor C2H2 family [Helianthus annuus]|uniref:RING-type E3 ubiquitin transferase n=1 Tax=Helianthus annuus TaxID=4232 RepID=A0A251T2J4_HELAN|nr:probable E3 ubiquitin-protein ligase ZFP1 [Helianthus annuus]KAF5778262.1 putative transcription factor C2H2 family [Helianthus annuus]KAJ0489696.1 putative transcription factor C2H2 family [Helianthus annuus]KAJ0493622.1 putative transcription factor C2H2 family [Helianthus annuus]KAJ0505613.1 putative transcription factor C2H2 family [Helianthus annuus]KAJ0675277.1 putative transcription factor C2H2 family [Helianthus annuus]